MAQGHRLGRGLGVKVADPPIVRKGTALPVSTL